VRRGASKLGDDLERARDAMVERASGFREFDANRFAELIVKECAGLAQYYYTRNECVSPQQIKQHFGIEE
jgi:hypothetical protein